MKPQTSEKISVSIERLGIYGEGVGSWNGFTIFVDGALPGEKVEARVVDVRKNFARAKVLQTFEQSPDRVKPPCPVFGRCGGCQIMHLEYGKQLEVKRARVQDALQRIGKIDAKVADCLPSPVQFDYRNKIQMPCKEGRLGLYAFNTHELVEIEKCYIHCPLGEKVFQAIRGLGLEKMRYVIIKSAVRTNQALVILVTHSGVDVQKLGAQIQEMLPEIRGVVQNINDTEGNTILGKENRLLAGEGFIHDTICGLTFKVSPVSFFQVNYAQVEKMYEKAVELCALTGNETVLDAYCGVGTLSLLLAQKAKHVIGVESIPAAIDDARENSQINGITNVEFKCAAVDQVKLESIDVALVNPPRKGCDPEFLNHLMSVMPKRIVYISCDPATLARDLALFSPNYHINTVQPFDMFPQTVHVETVVLLEAR